MSENLSAVSLKISLPESLSSGMRGAVSRGAKAAEVDPGGHLKLTLTDNSCLDLGNVHGVDIVSVEQTSSSADSGGDNVICVTLSDGSTHDFTVKNGGRGAAGPSGVHYGSETPEAEDVLIWLDPGGTQQLFGVTEESISGGHRISFITPTQTKTVDIMDGVSGERGSTGAKGEKGDTGETGPAGPKGDTGAAGAAGAAGPRGATGATGAAGYTPVRGTDYWTDADIAVIHGYVDYAIFGGAW